MPILAEFQPQLILVSCGFDACTGHAHPLGGYELTPACETKRTPLVLID
jgi:acetoin utilization deacetylase AcuC-like enzyme